MVTGAAGPRGVTSAGTLQRGGQQEDEEYEDNEEDTEDGDTLWQWWQGGWC